MPIPAGYTSGQIVQAVPTGINSGLVCVKAETAITAATTVNIDNVFTSDYTNYIINLVYQGSTTDDVFARFRVGGVDASGANYNSQEIQALSTTVNGYRNTGMTSWNFAQNSSGVKSSSSCMLFGPQLATATTMQQTESNSLGSYTNLRYKVQALNHTLATAYDGLTLFSATAFTGTYAIYGFSKTV